MKDGKDKKKLVSSHKIELENISKKINKLIEMNLNNLIDGCEFLKKKSEYKQREYELQNIMNNLEKGNDDVIMDDIKAFLKFDESACKIFNNASIEQKRMILSCVGSNLFLKDKKLQISVEKPILYLKDINELLRGRERKSIRFP